LVAKGFTPRQVTSIEPKVREFVADRIEKLRAKGGGDIITEFLKPLPSMVVAHYLGVPEKDWDRFDAWTDAIVAANATGHAPAAGPAIAELFTYFNELIAYRQKHPGDDTVSHLVEAGFGADGDMSGILSILGFAFTMITGGNDTTTGMLGGAVQLLTARRDQRQLLIDDPTLIPDAVEEMLRLTSPVQGLARMTTRDVEIGGTTIPAGRKTFLLYGSGNRDDRQFGPDAEELNVLRRPSQILTFSHGNHHCLGAAAARMQARVALEELLARCPDFDVDADAVEYAEGSYVRRPTHLPFTTRP
jgi:cytochrome P450